MSHYQSFPNKPGSADSAGKLASLLLPPLAGKSFLDAGCNEGFFCGYAAFEAASKIVGIDKDKNAIELAKARFPYCEFRHGDWENLGDILAPGEKFDVILMASALYYSVDQAKTLNMLMDRLTSDGVLILETGIVENPAEVECTVCAPGWYEVRRSIDSRKFTDWKGVESLLENFAYKHAGKSVSQIGDPLPRHVFHIQKLKPTAILITGDSASGKSTLARLLSKAVKVLKGDEIVWKIGAQPQAYGKLGEMVGEINSQRIDKALWKICRMGGIGEFAKVVAQCAGSTDFIYDGYIPAGYDIQFADHLENLGFRICNLKTGSPSVSLHDLSRRSRVEARKYMMFINALESSRTIRNRLR